MVWTKQYPNSRSRLMQGFVFGCCSVTAALQFADLPRTATNRESPELGYIRMEQKPCSQFNDRQAVVNDQFRDFQTVTCGHCCDR